MKCTEVKNTLDAFVDDEIDFFEKKLIEDHLEHCALCRAESEELRAVGRMLRRDLPAVAAPSPSLDGKVMSAFRDFHAQQRPAAADEEKRQKTGWFGIPRFAFAAGIVLFALIGAASFQLGKMSGGDLRISMTGDFENGRALSAEDAAAIRVVEVPVVREKIVEVPVVREKIVTRTIYIEKKPNETNAPPIAPDGTFALNNSVKDGEFLTHTNLEGFQPVAEIKAIITKKEEED